MIVNVRGISSAGKTTTVKNVMELLGGFEAVRNEEGRIIGHRGDGLFVVGPYEGQTPLTEENQHSWSIYKGCDALGDEETEALVLEWSQKGDVLFEGGKVSHDYAKSRKLNKVTGGMVWAYLDTPLKDCICRGYGRRDQGNPESAAFRWRSMIEDLDPYYEDIRFSKIGAERARCVVKVLHNSNEDPYQAAREVIAILGR